MNTELDKKLIKKIYEILDFAEEKLTYNFPSSQKEYRKWTAMLDVIPKIREALNDTDKKKTKK